MLMNVEFARKHSSYTQIKIIIIFYEVNMSKKLTTEQIKTIAKENNIPYAALRAVIEVEA